MIIFIIKKIKQHALASYYSLAYAFFILIGGAACTQKVTIARDNNISNKQNQLAVEKEQWPQSFNIGRPATEQEIAKLDIDVQPDGKGLPTGSGTVIAGKAIYASKCAACHGRTGIEGPNNRLVSHVSENKAYGTEISKEKTIGNYWPYATTLFDYIRRAMPFNAPGSLTNEEVYSVTAFLLQANDIIPPDGTINAENLPKIIMPAQKHFVTDDRKGGPEVR